MNTDFRLATALFTHPKFIKLQRRLGDAGALAFIRLLAFVTQNKPDGNLHGMDAEEIAIAGDYSGNSSEFVETLVAVRFLDKTEDGGYIVHDWAEHNPWAANAPQRSEVARKAANARWGASNEPAAPAPVPPASPKPATRTPEQSGSDASRMRPASSGNAPYPTIPLPSPNPSHPSPNPPVTITEGGTGGTDAGDDGDEQDGRAGGSMPIGRDDGHVLSAVALSPEELLSRFRSSDHWPMWETHIGMILRQGKTRKRSEAMYLKPVILRILRGEEPEPGETLAATQERLREVENIRSNRVVTAEKPRFSVPADWLPGADDLEARSLCNQAWQALRIADESLAVDSEVVRDKARRLWERLYPDRIPAWGTVPADAPIESHPVAAAFPLPVTADSSKVRDLIAASLSGTNGIGGLTGDYGDTGQHSDYSVQNNSGAVSGGG